MNESSYQVFSHLTSFGRHHPACLPSSTLGGLGYVALPSDEDGDTTTPGRVVLEGQRSHEAMLSSKRIGISLSQIGDHGSEDFNPLQEYSTENGQCSARPYCLGKTALHMHTPALHI